jgi:hypothetical protein
MSLDPDTEANLRCRIKDLEKDLGDKLDIWQSNINNFRKGLLDEEYCWLSEVIIDECLKRNRIEVPNLIENRECSKRLAQEALDED